jgi:hypothetical protein
MAVVAVLEIHIERNMVGSMNPSINSRGLVPKHKISSTVGDSLLHIKSSTVGDIFLHIKSSTVGDSFLHTKYHQQSGTRSYT